MTAGSRQFTASKVAAATKTESKAATPDPRSRRRRIISSVIIASILVHLVFGIIAGFWIVARYFEKPKARFQVQKVVKIPAEERQNRLETEQVESLRPKPVYNNRISSLRPSNLAMPDLPKLPVEEIVKIDTEALVNDQIDSLSTSHTGQGLGAGGGFFGGAGKAGSGLLEGTFYDLKQTADGKPSGVNAGNYVEVLRKFGQGFNRLALDRHYRASSKLYASRILMPAMEASEAPKAFGVADKVQPQQWVVLYKGRVKAPKSGKFRFVGTGDDVLLVRFGGRFVLEGSWVTGRILSSRKAYVYDIFRDSRLQSLYEDRSYCGGHSIGQTFDVFKGSEYDIEVLIGEGPGGQFYAQLLIEKIGESYPKDNRGNPILPFFQMVAQEVPDDIKDRLPPFQPNPPIWEPAPRKPVFPGR